MVRLRNPATLALACLGLILAATPIVRADEKKPGGPGDGPPAAAPAPDVEDVQDEVELCELRLELKRAEVDEAKANLDLAMKALARGEELAKNAAGAISPDELDQRRAAADTMKARLRVKDVEVREAEIHLRQAKRRLDRAKAAQAK